MLCWPAADVAELLDSTVASVNSALQRARATLAESGRTADAATAGELGEAERELLARYVRRSSATTSRRSSGCCTTTRSISMPPFAMWLRGTDDLRGWYLGYGIGCKGSRLLPLEVSGSPGFAQYKPSPDGRLLPWSIQVLELRDGRVDHIHHFLDTRLFARFGVPPEL